MILRSGGAVVSNQEKCLLILMQESNQVIQVRRYLRGHTHSDMEVCYKNLFEGDLLLAKDNFIDRSALKPILLDATLSMAGWSTPAEVRR